MPYKDREKRIEYAREYNTGWYQRHKENILEKKRHRQQEILDWFRRYKSALKCVDCGIKHPAVLCFHHRDPRDKDFTISDNILRVTSIKKLQKEIKKCDVVCMNCHAKRHWREAHKMDSWEEIVPSEEE